MAKKTSIKKGLSKQIKLWWILNGLGFINLTILFLDKISDTISSNNSFVHVIYNLTSTVIVIPFYIILIVHTLIFGVQPTLSNIYSFSDDVFMKLLAASFLLGFLINFLIANILFSTHVLNIYNRYIKPHPILKWGIPAVILFLFITG